MVNPLLDVQKALPASVDSENYGNYDDLREIELYEQMLREIDPVQQRLLMRRFEKHVLDDETHMIWVLWWHRIVPYRSYVKGFRISPTHFINQDLATIWLDK
jgi:peptide/nickel transport system substrate-binding protein